MNKIAVLLLCGFFSITPIARDVQAISSTTAEVFAGIGGFLTSAGTMWVGSVNSWHQTITIAAACGAGFLTYLAGSYLFHNFTPHGRYQRALSIMQECAMDRFLSQQLCADTEVYQCVATQLFCCEWPLVKANKRYLELHRDLSDAYGLLQSAFGENSSDMYFAQECKKLMEKVCFYREMARDRAMLMKKDIIEYDRQLSKYQKHQALLLQQQQLSLQQQQASYTWWDRWDRERHHREKMAYKKK